ncbi:MAG: PEGA domain-containing protein [Calditrichaeota bacterium]|nr:PEGA domain-containing protein [Calditrichota bacterium]
MNYFILIFFWVGFLFAQEAPHLLVRVGDNAGFSAAEYQVLNDSLARIAGDLGYRLHDAGTDEDADAVVLFVNRQRLATWQRLTFTRQSPGKPAESIEAPFVGWADWVYAPILRRALSRLLADTRQAEKNPDPSVWVGADSQPRGAVVFIDGELQRGATPIEGLALSPGRHHFYFRRENAFADTTVRVEPGQTYQINPLLEIKTFSVETDPPGVAVYLETRLLGETPLSVDLPPETFRKTVQFVKEGFVRERRTVDFREKSTIRIGDLTLPKAGSVQVVSDPPGAALFLNGDSIGVSPLWYREVPFGENDLEICLQGYQTRREKFTLPETRPYQKVTYPLTPLNGTLLLAALPSGTELKINGVPWSGSLADSIRIPAGTARLDFFCPGYRRYRTRVELAYGENHFLAPDLKPLKLSHAVGWSLLFPGAGQLYSRRYPEAALLGSGEAISLVLIGAMLGKIEDTRKDIAEIEYTLAQDITPSTRYNLELALSDQQDQLSSREKSRNWLFGLAGAVWLYNIYDAYRNFPPRREPRLSLVPTEKGLALSLKF